MNTSLNSRFIKFISYTTIAILLTSINGVAHSSNGGGYALDFDGIDDYVDFGTSDLFDFGTGDFSIELWVKYADLSGEQVLIEKFTDGMGPGWTLTKMPENTLRFATNCCDQIDAMPPSITTDTWYHIAVVRSSGTLTFYWNGMPFASGTNANDASGGSNLLLGRRSDDPNGQLLSTNGVFEEFRIWNVARTPVEIRENVHKVLAGDEPGLIGYWRLDDGDGTTVTDLTSNHNDGTLVNMDPDTDWVPSTAPIGDLTAGANEVTAIWGAQPSTVSDGFATGLDISNVSFLNAVGDDIVFGHNNAAFAHLTSDLPDGVDKRWARVWELVTTDLGSSGGYVDLTFDISDAGGNPCNSFSDSGTYYLLKRDADSSESFTTVPVVSASVSGDKLTFRVSASELASEFTLGAEAGSPFGEPSGSGNGGYALDFDGIDGYVDFGTSDLFDFGTGDFSIELWVKYADLASGTGHQVLIEKFTDGYGPGWSFLKMDNNAIRFSTNCCDEVDAMPPSITTDTWYHIALVRSAGTLTFYWNGTPFASGTNANDASGGSNLLLGRRSDDPNGHFMLMNGMFDEVRLWNVARTPAEIRENAHKVLAGDETGLIGYWRLDDASGTVVTDLTSNHNDGTLVNMDPGADWISCSAPVGDLTTGANGVTAIWGAQPSTVSDGFATGLDISDVSFLNAAGDDIVFGHNNAAFAHVITDLPAGVDKRWARVWELITADFGISGGNVDLTFDISEAGGNLDDSFSDTNTYCLLKRSAGSSDVFTKAPVVSAGLSGDQLTFQARVSDLGSEFTIGITAPRIFLPQVVKK